MLFFCPPKILHKHCFQFEFSRGYSNSQEKLKTMPMQNFGVTNKKHYGMLWYFWSGQSPVDSMKCCFNVVILCRVNHVLCPPLDNYKIVWYTTNNIFAKLKIFHHTFYNNPVKSKIPSTLHQVLATSIIQRIGNIIRNKGIEPFQRSMDQNRCGRGPKLLI